VKVNGSIVSWSCKKQKTVSTSTAEAEYVGISSVGKEILWTRSLLSELGFEQCEPSIVKCDNKAAVIMSAHDSTHEKSKHIDIAIHWIRECIANKQIKVEWCSTTNMEADILTKPLSYQPFMKLRQCLMK
jgi:hypothetical protein